MEKDLSFDNNYMIYDLQMKNISNTSINHVNDRHKCILGHSLNFLLNECRRDRDRMLVGFSTTYVISTYHH